MKKPNTKKRFVRSLLFSGIALGSLFLLQQSLGRSVTAESTPDPKKEAVVTHTEKVVSATVSSDIFKKINDATKAGKKLSQKELDELSYYMVQYAQSNYQFLSADNEIGTAHEGFTRLAKLYKDSGVDAPFTINEESGELKITRTIPKPAAYDQKIEQVQDKAKDIAKKVVDGKVADDKVKTEVVN